MCCWRFQIADSVLSAFVVRVQYTLGSVLKKKNIDDVWRGVNAREILGRVAQIYL